MVVQQCAGTPCQHIQLFDPLSSSLTKKKKKSNWNSLSIPSSQTRKGQRESGVKALVSFLSPCLKAKVHTYCK